MPLPDDQFSTTMKDVSSRIVNKFKNTLIPDFFHPFVPKLKFCWAKDQRLPFWWTFVKKRQILLTSVSSWNHLKDNNQIFISFFDIAIQC